ncbi:MAG: ATP-binding cassette domain-containing protein [Treponema sp.]|nr:ATP-binding cassette domain-containing protein [Treponema sp.]
MKKEVLRLDQVSILPYLRDINLEIYEGEIDALIGIDSLGLDYLIDTIQFNTPLHYGWVYYCNKKVNDYTEPSRIQNKIAVLEKNTTLIDSMTVAENLFVIRKGFKKSIVNYKILCQQTETVLLPIGLSLDPMQIVAELSPCEKWILELVKAWISGVKLVILRDISNLVTGQDLKRIYAALHTFAERKMSCLYICNHHQEAFEIGNRCFLMKQGRIIKCLEKAQMTDTVMAHYSYIFDDSISDKEREKLFQDSGHKRKEGFFCSMKDFTLSIGKGETVVILDDDNTIIPLLVNKLRNENPVPADLRIDGKRWHYGDSSSELIISRPTERMLFPQMSLLDNICFTLDKKLKYIWTTKKKREAIARDIYPIFGNNVYESSLYNIDTKTLYDIIYQRTLMQNPSFLCVVQPFASIDMYLRLHLLSYFDKFRERGMTICILSLSLSDSLQVADRMLIVKNGVIIKEYLRKDFHSYKGLSGSRPQ